VEKIHHMWSYGSDDTVLDDYALTTMTTMVRLGLARCSHALLSVSLLKLLVVLQEQHPVCENFCFSELCWTRPDLCYRWNTGWL